jgi:AcrR family transcriptional regulator
VSSNQESPKRAEIIAVAAERFGRDGYEDTKWADIASDVGVGATALYHYFESKQHCLFVIMDEALAESRARFDRITAEEPRFRPAFERIFADHFDLTPHDVQRLRVLVAEQGLLARPRRSPREEDARQAARERTRDLELAWTAFLARGIEQGAVRDSDPRLLARAILGLFNSIWHWYRPSGSVGLDVVARFYTARLLDIVGIHPDPAAGLLAA